ncbi:chemotaxis protein CheW [Massilia niastensis]|uniref:chemotaxis protein CheW n=1 Tax=Massilia niastensis TaxID=544911 RepID=UPI00036E3F3B|nr:chemotaxis protein CheW [Massilia niastensis]
MNPNTPFEVDTYLQYMRDVTRCERSLHELGMMWRMIESSARMNCPHEARAILPTMAATRRGFGQLEKELVASLAREKVGNALAELGTKAKYVADIVVRNLYERTADVGFLATDRELCAFVAGLDDDADAIRLRLRAYRSKYTVYDEIILLDLAGNVLVQIDQATPLEGSRDPLIAQTLACDGYVETFRHSDLRPGQRQALIYSQRMRHPGTGAVVGVLCLCFAFEEEMARIFTAHRGSARSNLLLLDAENRVIASADPLWIPLGAQVPVNHEAAPKLVTHAGREYLVRTCRSAGYQGYPGPGGWQGQAMIPLDTAFANAHGGVVAGFDPEVADGLLTHAHSFCPPLFDIMGAADTIRRVVWNGQVMTAGQGGELARLRSVLEQISETGARSNELFTHSIRELFDTVLASGLRDSEFVSHLLVDLLDRNLYERANDCRWWALSPVLRASLAARARDSIPVMQAVLAHINGLYTVYTSIFVYDRHGEIIAGTGAGQSHTRVDDETLAQVLALRTEQDYHVSPFAPSRLYGERPTYVYHAAIRQPGDGGQAIGGIGLVFDAEAEFSAMLHGALDGQAQVHAFFIDRRGAIIASTDPSRPVGATLEVDAALLALPNGRSASRIVVHDGQYAVMGCTVSHGYREFKASDGYRADVLAVVIESFGAVRARPRRADHGMALVDQGAGKAGGPEFATFFIGGDLLAIAAEAVQEAMPAAEVSPVSLGDYPGRVGVLPLDGGASYAWVFDLGFILSGRATAVDSGSQVVVVRHAGRTIGLLVSELHGVASFDPAQIVELPLAAGLGAMPVRQLIKANQGRLLIQVVGLDYLFQQWTEGEAGDDAGVLQARA